MNKLTLDQKKLIFDAVRYYQMNAIGPFKERRYNECDKILQQLESSRNFYEKGECDI